jgi:hypothetical protein
MIPVAKWLGAPVTSGVTTGTRAKDGDRQETCKLLDEALNDGELTMAEHRERIGAATNAVTLGDLQALLTDLQTDSTPVPPAKVKSPPKFGGRGILAAAFAVSVLLGVGVGWGLYGNTRSPLDFTSDPGAKPDGVAAVVLTPPTQLHSLGGLTGLMEQTRKRFGDAMGYQLVIYPTYAILDRADPSNAHRVLTYDYRGGWDDPTNSASGGASKGTPVDLGQFDIAATVGILRGAPQTLHMNPTDVKNTYLIIAPATDPTRPGTLSLSAYVSGDSGSGYIAFAGDGTIKRINPPS